MIMGRGGRQRTAGAASHDHPSLSYLDTRRGDR
jgi:hypothetical protein